MLETESNLQFQSGHLDRESSCHEKDSYATTDDDFVIECSSAENSIHIPAPSELSRLSAQRRTRRRCGKRPAEGAIIQIERKMLDPMQWRTQEFCSRGGVQQIQLRTEDRENGDLGALTP
jgi:hypothetical protein